MSRDVLLLLYLKKALYDCYLYIVVVFCKKVVLWHLYCLLYILTRFNMQALEYVKRPHYYTHNQFMYFNKLIIF